MSYDPNFGDVVTLLHFDAAPGTTAIADSTNSLFWSVVGTAVISGTQGKFGSTSLELDGSGASLVCSHSPGLFSILNNWTIECWVFRSGSAVSKRDVICSKYVNFSTDGFVFQIGAGSANPGKLGFSFGTTQGVFQVLSGMSNVPLNEWVHVAATKQNNTLRLFINGIQDGQLTFSGTPADNGRNISIGKDSVATDRNFQGFIDEFRFTNYARYTNDFTPPSAPFPDEREPYTIGVTEMSGGMVALDCYQIYGSLENLDDTPAVACRVHLLAEDKLTYKSSTMTDAGGMFHFFAPDFGVKKYSVICYDKTGINRAVIGNDVTAELV